MGLKSLSFGSGFEICNSLPVVTPLWGIFFASSLKLLIKTLLLISHLSATFFLLNFRDLTVNRVSFNFLPFNFNFIYCFGLIDLFLANVHTIIFACVLLGLKSYASFQNRRSAQREFDLISQAWSKPKLHDTKSNYHFITTILKSQNSVAQIFLGCTKFLLIHSCEELQKLSFIFL